MRCVMIGTTAAASSRSARTPPGTAVFRARSADSRTVISPIGLSSRTTSPVSVIQAVVRRPLNAISTRNAGIGVPAERTNSRLPTSMVTGAL